MSIPFATLVDEDRAATIAATGAPSVTAAIDWGDGTTTTVDLAAGDGTHTYAHPGLFDVQVLIPGVSLGRGSLVVDGTEQVGSLFSEDTDQTTLTPPFPESCWPVDVSCVEDWHDTITIPADPEADPPVLETTEPKYPDHLKAYAVSLAGQTMRLLTAFRVGGCPITVRPCMSGCSERTWQTYPVVGFTGSTPWFPVNLGGQWLNISCGCLGSCSCSATSEVVLHGPASAVTQVKVDGDVLDPSAYRLDLGGRLVRVDGDQWPLCQNLDAPDTEEGTWSVTYLAAAAVDGIGAIEAGRLAGQYVRACTGGQCDLPKTVTQIVRAGVTQTLAPGAFPNGKTGIKTVDAYLERWNPTGARGRISRVWSPDVGYHRPVSS